MIIGPCWLLKYPILRRCKFASKCQWSINSLFDWPKKLSYVDTFIQFSSVSFFFVCVCVCVQCMWFSSMCVCVCVCLCVFNVHMYVV